MSGLNLANGIFRGITVQAQKRVKTDRIDCLTAGKIKFECPAEFNGDIEGDNLTGRKDYNIISSLTVPNISTSIDNLSILNTTYYELNGDAFVNFESSFDLTSSIANNLLILRFTTDSIPFSLGNTRIVDIGVLDSGSQLYNFNITISVSGNNTEFILQNGAVNLPVGTGYNLKFNIRYRNK